MSTANGDISGQVNIEAYAYIHCLSNDFCIFFEYLASAIHTAIIIRVPYISIDYYNW